MSKSLKSFEGPERRTYYDMNPWYQKNRNDQIFDWHQHVEEADQDLLRFLKVKLQLHKPCSVLEVGCGGGDFTLRYSQQSFSHVAFEFSDVAVEMARSKPNPYQIRFRQADALDESAYSDSPFDFVVAKDVLHCLLREDRKVFLKNLKGALSDRGLILLTTHAGLPKNQEVLKLIDLTTRENHLSTRVYLEQERIEAEFAKVGLEPLEIECLAGQLVLYLLRSRES
ncbi:MAG: class I SAM-dependent methyltransferase [Pseudomonadota bacterium]